MKTEVISTVHKEDAGTQLGAELIQNGELVAFPTETVPPGIMVYAFFLAFLLARIASTRNRAASTPVPIWP